jgi:hypothetical protein
MGAPLSSEREVHRQDVIYFLRKRFSVRDWELTLPHGWGHETYFAAGNGRTYFVKLGGQTAQYEAMTALGLTPPVLAAEQLGDGTAVLVQPAIKGRTPSRRDFQEQLEPMAAMVRQMHHSPEIQRVLPSASSPHYRDAGLAMLNQVQARWVLVKESVPSVAGFVDKSLARLKQEILAFTGSGLAASHNDICNANWLIAGDGRIYLIDLDAMSLDDPANDMGALLWWYYPPPLRQRFLEIAGHPFDAAFRERMRVRMALHCLHIILPRPQSFDQFDSAAFPQWLTDFRAVMAGEENPQGYQD